MNKTYPLIILIVFLLYGCKKKVLDIIPVAIIEKDISIKGAYSLDNLCVVNDKVMYVASYGQVSSIYKTINGGTTWQKLNFVGTEKVNALDFFNENEGFCLSASTIYITADGGNTWLANGYAKMLTKTADNRIVALNNYFNNYTIKESKDKGATFIVRNTFWSAELDYAYADIDNIYVFSNVSTAIKVSTTNFAESEIELDFSLAVNSVNDTYNNFGSLILVGSSGDIYEDSGYGGQTRYYYGHNHNYYSIDGKDGTVVCAGYTVLTTNKDFGEDEEWNELFDKDGNTYLKTFTEIKMIDKNSFYVCCSSGEIYKMKI
jgi:hypothetical protein